MNWKCSTKKKNRFSVGTKAARIKKNAKKNPYRSSRWCMCAMKYGSVNGCRWLHTYNSKTCLLHLVCRFRLYFFLFLFHTCKHKHTRKPLFAHYLRPIFFSPCHKLRLYCFQCVNNIIFQCQLLMYLWTNDSKKNGFEGLQDGELRLKNLVHILRLKKNFSPLYAPKPIHIYIEFNTKATEIHVYGRMHGRAFVFVCTQRV